MHSASWRQRPLPAPVAGAVPVAVRECVLQTPMDVTVCRGLLRGDLTSTYRAVVSDELLDRLLLVFEELASNGLRHGRAPVRGQVSHTGDEWLVVVIDAAPDQPPCPALDRDPAQGGLGLHLVARLCAACGWVSNDDRKHVWGCLRPT